MSTESTNLIECEEIKDLMAHTERLPDNTVEVHGSIIVNGEERFTDAAEANQLVLVKLDIDLA